MSIQSTQNLKGFSFIIIHIASIKYSPYIDKGILDAKKAPRQGDAFSFSVLMDTGICQNVFPTAFFL